MDNTNVNFIVGLLGLAYYIVILVNIVGINKSLKKIVELHLMNYNK